MIRQTIVAHAPFANSLISGDLVAWIALGAGTLALMLFTVLLFSMEPKS